MNAGMLSSYYLAWQATPGLRRARQTTVIVSLLLSALAVLLDGLPNNDAYTYVRTAEIALESGALAAYQHYQWAHYPLLLAGIHQITGIDLFTVAWLLNAALFALLSVSFVNLVAAMTASRRVVWLAVLCVLTYPHLNEFRSLIIRDIGFLAFSLIALLQLVRYQQWLRIRYAAGFTAACMAATLFRPEALLLMWLTPTCILFDKRHVLGTRCRIWLRLIVLAIGVPAILTIAVAASGLDFAAQLQTFLQSYQPFLANLGALFGNVDPQLEEAIFGTYAAQFVGDYSHLFMAFGLAAMLLACLVDSLGLAVAPLLIFGFVKRYLRLPADAARTIISWLLVSFLILLGFTLLTRFITTRYTLLCGVLLLLYVPFIIDRAWSAAAARGRLKRFATVMLLLGTYAVLDAHISFGPPKRHLVDATQWINAHIRESTEFVTNNYYIAYHSGRVPAYDEIRRDLTPGDIRNAPLGTVFAVEPRRSFETVLEAEAARGALRQLHRANAPRGRDLIIYEKMQP